MGTGWVERTSYARAVHGRSHLNADNAMKWFGSLGLFRHEFEGLRRIPKYELRTTICRARSLKSARARFLKEFADYAQDGIRFLNQWEVFEIDGTPGRIPIEAAHQMITTDLSPKEFIKMHWLGDRPESCKEKGWTHAWHNVDGTHSGCYNCRAIRKGRLWGKAANKTIQRVPSKLRDRNR